MKNIQVGSIVRVKDDPHRYVVDSIDIHGCLIMFSVIDHSILDFYEPDDPNLKLVEGIERVQRGDLVKDTYDRILETIEVGFNSFSVMYGDGIAWYTFQEAKDWKIVREVEDRQGPPEVELEWRGKPRFEDQKCEYCSKEAHKTYFYNGSLVAWLCDKHDKEALKSPEEDKLPQPKERKMLGEEFRKLADEVGKQFEEEEPKEDTQICERCGEEVTGGMKLHRRDFCEPVKEEEPREHTIFPDDLVAPLTDIRRMKIDGTEYTIDYILKAIKEYEK